MTAVQPAKTRQGGAEGTQSASSDPLSLRSLRVGDEVGVVVTDLTHLTGRRRVVRVARCYLYTGERCPGFDLKTGRQNDNYGNTYAYTLAAYERRLQVDEVRRVLFNLSEDWYRMPEDRLLAIHDALKAAGLL